MTYPEPVDMTSAFDSHRREVPGLMPTQPAETAVSATEGAAEGTEQGEAVESVEKALRAIARQATLAALPHLNAMAARAETAHDLKDEANNRWLAVVAERDGLRRKLDAVRALCDEAESSGLPVVYLSTSLIRVTLGGEA